MRPLCPVIPDENEVVFAKDQSEYNSLPAVKLDCRQGEVITRWKPDLAELEALNNGASIYLHVWTFGGRLQPVLLEVNTPENIRTKINIPHSLRYIELVEEDVLLDSNEQM